MHDCVTLTYNCLVMLGNVTIILYDIDLSD